jgi:hypothetical protein
MSLHDKPRYGYILLIPIFVYTLALRAICGSMIIVLGDDAIGWKNIMDQLTSMRARDILRLIARSCAVQSMRLIVESDQLFLCYI